MTEASTWDGLAGRYDRVVRLFDRSYPAIRDRLREDLAGRGRILEVAAGTGQFTAELAEICEELIATDVSPEMVRLLDQSLAERGVDGVSTAVMGAYALDAEDGSFHAYPVDSQRGNSAPFSLPRPLGAPRIRRTARGRWAPELVRASHHHPRSRVPNRTPPSARSAG